MLKVGDQIAWNMRDGNVMTGTITQMWADTFTVKRVDGGICSVKRDKVRAATYDDVMAAVKFFAEIGK